MEPVTIAIITPFLIELAKKGLEKATEKSAEKLSDGTINWLKKTLFKGDKPKDSLAKFGENPEKTENQIALKTLIENSIEEDTSNLTFWNELQKIKGHSESVLVDNRGAKIGQQNIKSTVTNNKMDIKF